MNSALSSPLPQQAEFNYNSSGRGLSLTPFERVQKDPIDITGHWVTLEILLLCCQAFSFFSLLFSPHTLISDVFLAVEFE